MTRVGWACVALVAAAAIASVALDLGFWIVAIAASVPWFIAITRRFGSTAALALVVLGLASSFTAALMANAVAQLPMSLVLVVVASVIGLGGSALLREPGEPYAANSTLGRAPWLASALGPAIWITAQAVTWSYTFEVRVGWAMRNDIGNSLAFAHEVIDRAGISAGPAENPAPLTAALMAAAIQPGRTRTAPSLLLEHDLLAISVLWGALISLTCLLAGLVVASIASALGADRRLVTAGAALGSLAVLSWLFTGYPLEYGFLNTHVVLPVLLAGVLLFLSGRRHPVLGAAGLLMAVGVTIVSWSPLAVLPAALLAVHCAQSRRILRATRGVRLACLALGLLIAIGAGGIIALPSLLAQREALSGAGGIYNPGSWVMFAVAIACSVLAFFLAPHRRAPVALGVAALAVSSVAGLCFLLFISRRAPDPWTYYPVKFSWLASLLLIVVLLGLAVAGISRLNRNRAVFATGITIITACVGGLIAWTPFIVSTHVTMNPVDRILRSQLVEAYPETARAVFALSDPRHPAILWKSDLYSAGREKAEGEANIWLIQAWVDSLRTQQPLRLLAYTTYFDKSIAGLCDIAERMGPGLTVVSAEPGLETDLARECSDVEVSVISSY